MTEDTRPMVIAALVTFALLLAAWIAAPSTAPHAQRQEPEPRAIELAPEAA